METTLSFTPAQLVAICAGILTMIALSEKIINWVKKLQQPNQDQNARLDEIDKKLDRDKKRLEAHDLELEELQNSTKILQQGVYELLGNAIEKGNNVEGMQTARNLLKQNIFDGKRR